jgi:RND family efflux transporter MFP subunit
MPFRIAYLGILIRGCAALLLAVTLASCSETQGQPKQAAGKHPPLPAVTVAQALQKPVTEWDEFTGRFEAVDTVSLRARVSGYITAVQFTDGQTVKAGDPLFVIDPRPFEQTVARAHADLAAARARFDYAQADMKRGAPLLKKEAITEQVFEQRKKELGQADAAVKAAEATLAAAELDLQFTRVTAPLGGTTGRRLVGVGNYVTGASATGTLLTTIVSSDPIDFYFDISEADYLKYARLGKTAAALVSGAKPVRVFLALQDEKGFAHEGRMDFVDNRIDGATATLRGRAVFPNPDGLFKPGLFARVRLSGNGEQTAMLLPDEAIGTDQTNRFVYVVADDGTVAYRPVMPGPLAGGLRVIRSGVGPGDWVIIKGVQKARPGTKVTPQRGTVDPPGKQAALP